MQNSLEPKDAQLALSASSEIAILSVQKMATALLDISVLVASASLKSIVTQKVPRLDALPEWIVLTASAAQSATLTSPPILAQTDSSASSDTASQSVTTRLTAQTITTASAVSVSRCWSVMVHQIAHLEWSVSAVSAVRCAPQIQTELRERTDNVQTGLYATTASATPPVLIKSALLDTSALKVSATQ